MLVAVTLVNVAVLAALLPLLAAAVTALLEYIDRSGSDEMLTLAAVVMALFVSFGMDAIVRRLGRAGGVLRRHRRRGVAAGPPGHRGIRPLRNLFGVLFFASVGMLLDPMTFVRMPLHVLTVVLIIVVAKPVIAAAIAMVLRQTHGTALAIGAGLAQIGEFSFILGTLGRSLGLLPEEAYQLIIAGAIISIALNPVAFRVTEMIGRAWQPAPAAGRCRWRPAEAAPEVGGRRSA